MKDLKLSAATISYVKQEQEKLVASDNTKVWRVSFRLWKEKRGISSNNQIHLWFNQIALKLGYKPEKESDGYIKNSCKVLFGIDILMGSKSKQAQSVIRTLERVDYWSLPWADKLDVVNGVFVTSLFETDEMKVFMDQMIFYWNDKDVHIKFKD